MWGLSAGDNASVSVFETAITGNLVGVFLTTGATALMGAGNRINDNRAEGVRVWEGSRTTLGGGVVIEGNGGMGVFVTGGSLVQAFDATIQNNQGSGIHLADTSLAGGTLTDKPIITGNAGWGVFCDAPPAVAQVRLPGLPAATILGNAAGTTNCPGLGIPGRVP
jgi:hypothetical protein